MLVYKDMTFCPYHMCKNFGKACHRSLTAEVREDARRVKLDISIFVDPPDCFEEKEKQIFKSKGGKEICPVFP